MNKKLLSALLLGALTVTSTGTLVSCKDYDDDIAHLQDQIDANKSSIEEIMKLVKAGSVITNVSSTTGGVTVTLSDGKSFTLTNGADGKDGVDGKNGTAWTIGEDGYWYQDGKKTAYKAQGDKGDKGDQGDKGDKGDKGDTGAQGPQGPAGTDGATGASVEYYVPNSETECFDVYKDGEFVRHTDISYVSKNGITATKDNDALTIYGLKGVEGPVTISLSGLLKGLVSVPGVYLDGIETTIYPWLKGKLLVGVDNKNNTTRPSDNQPVKFDGGIVDASFNKISGAHLDWTPNSLDGNPIANANAKDFQYGKTIGVKYHLNPANAKVAYANVKGYNVLEPEVIYTRAAAGDLNVTSPEKTLSGKVIFGADNDGILTAGLNIEKPWLLNENPTSTGTSANRPSTDNVIALQMTNSENSVITSDYTLLRPTKVTLDGLRWNTNMVLHQDENCKGDESLGGGDKVYVFDSPEEAALNQTAALDVYYDSQDGIVLKDQLAISVVEEDLKNGGTKTTVMTNAEAAEWGLSYKFNLVDYKVGTAETKDSRYAKLLDANTGKIRAWNVKYDELPAGETSKTAVGREPLVQVLVKNKDGKVVLDGYIRIRITDKPSAAEITSTTVSQYPTTATTFDLCNAADVMKTTWAQFNDYVLTATLDNLTKEKFDEQYTIDTDNAGTSISGAATNYADIKQFASDQNPATATPEAIGEISFIKDNTNVTNHRFTWTISEAELEKLTHDTTTPVPVTRYVRFKGANGAKYDYLYVKLSTTITRADNTMTFKQKDNNYWYGLDGNKDGWDAVVFDVKEPVDNGNILTFTGNIPSTLVSSETNIITNATNSADNNGKYYFAPITKEVRVGNVTYKISPVKNSTTAAGAKLVCKYHATDSHAFAEINNGLLSKCAIDYAAGAFNNTELYAQKGNGAWSKIATLNQQTGEIALDKSNSLTKEVLNAIGYAENHANIDTELRAMVGIIAKNSCGVAKDVKDGIFTASFQRPINIEPIEGKTFIDANTNGNSYNLIDYIKMYDWRGPQVGFMNGTQAWFWGYYNVKQIKINTKTSDVETNLHHGNTFVKLNTISEDVLLGAKTASGAIQTNQVTTYNFNLTGWANAGSNSAVLNDWANNPEKYGVIYYANNGNNVTDFKVRIPVTIVYEWGEFTQKVEFTITKTAGN